jgi:hypothetical protein
MKTEDRRVCPSCGNEFAGAVEFCPVCMLHGALADEVDGESSSERVTKPKSQGVARRFQHYGLLIGEDGRPVELGRGAMGVTYKAFDGDLRCPVTLKVISEKYLGDESARLRFLREARVSISAHAAEAKSIEPWHFIGLVFVVHLLTFSRTPTVDCIDGVLQRYSRCQRGSFWALAPSCTTHRAA